MADRITLDALRPGERREILIVQVGDEVAIYTLHESYSPPEPDMKRVKRFLKTIKIYPPGYYFRMVTEGGRKALNYRLDKLRELSRKERMYRRLG